MNQNKMLHTLLTLLLDCCQQQNLQLDAQTDLFETDLLDSLAMIELLEGIEDQFGVTLEPTRIPRERFRTAESIVQLIESAI